MFIPLRQPAAQISRTHRGIRTAMILSRQKSKSAYRTRNEVGSSEPISKTSSCVCLDLHKAWPLNLNFTISIALTGFRHCGFNSMQTGSSESTGSTLCMGINYYDKIPGGQAVVVHYVVSGQHSESLISLTSFTRETLDSFSHPAIWPEL
jgi:hypothetical protein